MKPSTYSRSKAKWNHRFLDPESEALNDVCKVNNVSPLYLQAAHTDKKFIWIYDHVQAKMKLPFEISKEEFSEELDALRLAKEYFDTFEGNLRTEHTETAWVYSKIRQH